mmetsp:Transcript_8225/g.13765  ORF Transcript_8225/g.13765 Transcript_8225/m.13765 type:complete len:115 (+) Transcript_8225:183-527(+)
MAAKMVSDHFGYDSVKLNQLYPASTLAALYVKNKLPDAKKVRVIGNEELLDELAEFGIETEGGCLQDLEYNDPKNAISIEKLDQYELDPNVAAIIHGNDPTVNYAKLAIASLYI